ncbi:hypothetical protein [Nostoc sp. DSM 114161]|uniref:hypothetical protein n=1 Tax=Nostoc sp. DSM 114161 TaxID=3440143 RepID=UPI004045831B
MSVLPTSTKSICTSDRFCVPRSPTTYAGFVVAYDRSEAIAIFIAIGMTILIKLRFLTY